MLRLNALAAVSVHMLCTMAFASQQSTKEILIGQGNELKALPGCENTYIGQHPLAILETAGKQKERQIVSQNKSAKAIDDYILKVNAQKLGLPGSYLQATMDEKSYAVMKCQELQGTKTYAIFDVYNHEEVDAVTQVAIDTKSQLFKEMQVFTADEAHADAEKDLEKRMQLQTTSQLNIQQNLADSEISKIQNQTTPEADSSTSEVEINSVSVQNSKQASVATQSDAKSGTQGSAQQASLVIKQEDIKVKSLRTVICTQGDTASLRSENLEKVLAQILPLQPVLVIQQWTTQGKTKKIDGKEHKFIKIQTQSNNKSLTGWVSESLVKPMNECSLASELELARSRKKVRIPVVAGARDGVFPTLARPTASYKSGMRKFGARRSGGRRVHAAVDLYRHHGERIRAITSGVVLQDPYFFYQGTFALEVKHANGLVMRYGENKGRNPVGAGEKITAGQTIAYMGTVNSGCCSPMLHLEMYSGRGKGPLSQPRRRGYQRRADLMNPTSYVSQLERKTFGSSY